MRRKYLGALVAVMLVAGACGVSTQPSTTPSTDAPGASPSSDRFRAAAKFNRALCRAGDDGCVPRRRSRRQRPYRADRDGLPWVQ